MVKVKVKDFAKKQVIMYDPSKAHYVSATCIIVKDGRYLITQRGANEKNFPNMWTVPGGKLETTDYTGRPKDTKSHWYNVLEAVTRREVLEETGLRIKNIRYLASMSYIRSDDIPQLIISLYADYDFGDIVLETGLGGSAWVTLEEAKKYDLIEGIYEELTMLDARLKGSGPDEWKKGQE